MNNPYNSNDRPDIPEDVTPADYFNNLVIDRINKSPLSKIKTLNTLIEFHITGENGGRWGLVIENGNAKASICASCVNSDPYPQRPACTFKMDNLTFLSIVRREITPQKAFFARKVDIQGDIFLALKANILVNYL